jgi:tRNA-Thr(GGU) m(6)t(6)A37 methyltransferase TsaA
VEKTSNSLQFGDRELFIKPVGFVKSDLKKPSLKANGEGIELEQGLRKAVAEAKIIHSLVCDLIIHPRFQGILDGLEDFSHAVVLYWPHLLPTQGRSLIKVHPMGLKEFPLVGVFATCSPARPNPILVTTVRIVEKKENILTVQGLEALDGSPIIDIKPYTTNYLSADDVKMPDWMNQIHQTMSYERGT